MPSEWKYKWVHDRLGSACFQISYYRKTKTMSGDVLRSADFLMPDGTHPKASERIICGFCKKDAFPGLHTTEVEIDAQA